MKTEADIITAVLSAILERPDGTADERNAAALRWIAQYRARIARQAERALQETTK